MKETEWQDIAAKLNEAGFAVSYSRISYAPDNPLWRANAVCEGREWITLGMDLRSTLLALEKQTQETAGDWRAAVLSKAANLAMAGSPQAF
jgi:hypothetical protein